MEAIDIDLTRILVNADAKCRPQHLYPWSPDLHNAYLDHRYWSIRLTETRTKRSHATALEAIKSKLGPKFIPLSPPDTISTRLRRARHQMRQIRRDAIKRRQQHLQDMLREARAANNTERKQLILGLKHAEETRQCFALVRQILHSSTPGGLTHILIPRQNDKLEWVRVTDVAQMEEHLLEHGHLHFRTAHGTPFTQPPLSQLLDFSGLTPFGDLIFEGRPIPDDIKLTPATRLLLTHQRSMLLPHVKNTHPLEFEALMHSIRKWPERTTTSPSGRHLGIYKSLLKDKPPTDPPANLPPRTYGEDVMRYIYRLMQLALKHTYVFERWRTVWNMYLEKSREIRKLISSARFISSKLIIIYC